METDLTIVLQQDLTQREEMKPL